MFLGEKLVGANFYAFCNYAEIENIDFQNICQLWALIIEVTKDDFVHLAGNPYLLNASV